MRKRYLEDLAFYWLTLAFKGFFSLFPYKIGVALGAGLLYLLSFLYPRRFDVAYMNLKSAFPDKAPPELKWIVHKSVFHLALSLMEFMLSSKIDREYLISLVHLQGLKFLEEEYKKGSGIIFLTAHYDNWELLSLIGGGLGYPSFVIAREQKYSRLNNLLNRYRGRWGNIVVEKGLSMKKIIRALRDKKCIGILADQNAGRAGLQVKLFGKYASTNPGFIELARVTSSVVLPVFLKRVGLYKHIMEIYPRLNLNREKELILSEYNKILESYIKRSPEQWLWFHKRWKHSPNKSILLLSDAKAGHYKQSRVVAEQLKQLLSKKMQEEWGIEEDIIKIYEVVVKWKSSFRKNILYLMGLFSSNKCQGCLRCLKWALEKDSYLALIRKKYDYIVSCGSSLLALNSILKYENKAVNINILSPPVIYRDKFNLIFLPQHDNLRGRNIIRYKGALVKKDIEKAKNFIKKGKIQLEESALKLGVLIGGGIKRYPMDRKAIENLLSFIDSFANRKLVNLLISTSRRTSPEIERMLETFLKDKSYLKLLIIANKFNPPGVYESLLYLSDAVIVTSDSISMISEALGYGKKVIVYETSRGIPKNTRFLKKLAGENLIKLIKPGEIEEITEFISEEKKVVFDNLGQVERALTKLI